MANPYRDENGLMFNKLGITDSETLKTVEYLLSSSKARMILSGEHLLPTSGYGLDRLKEINREMFGDIYQWAGEERITPSSKHDPINRTVTIFPEPEKIAESWKPIEKAATEFASSQNLSLEEKRQILADIFIEANHSHPFPEGNGRTLQVFMSQLAAEQGLMMDYSNINQSLWNTASAVSGPHNRLFERVHLIPQNPDKRPIQNLFESIVQPLPQPNLQPLQDNKQTVGAKDFSPDKFQKLSDEYHKNSHLLSPLQ